ncbi:MAG: 30S ribosomal protein S11 [bacterium]|nr:30S ribosomal protein S11 [bacterium]
MPKKTSKQTFPPTVNIYVTAGFNNTLVTVADSKGNTLIWHSCGRAGFKGTRKSTPFAATTTVKQVVDQLEAKHVSSAKVFLKGPGPGRDAALKTLKHSKIKLTLLADVTPIPHNGCRLKKPKRG